MSGHTYHLRVDVAFSSLLSLVNGLGFNVDNIGLTVYFQKFSNGTLALITALQSLRISGEVITTPFTLFYL